MSQGLEHLAIVYFNEDWRTSGRWWPGGIPWSLLPGPVSPEECVAGFKQGAPGEVGQTIAELDALIASPMSEVQLCRRWLRELGAGYDPARDGLTYRQWFTDVRRLLAE